MKHGITAGMVAKLLLLGAVLGAGAAPPSLV